MLERDYILRIIRTFFQALEGLFGGDKKEEDFEKELETIYVTYFGRPRREWLAASPEQLKEYLEGSPHFLEKCGMLGDLFYQEYQKTTDKKLKLELAVKIIFLYEYVNNHSSDYSWLYASRIAELKASQ